MRKNTATAAGCDIEPPVRLSTKYYDRSFFKVRRFLGESWVLPVLVLPHQRGDTDLT